MKNFVLFLIFLVSINFSFSQNRVEGTDYIYFSVQEEKDTIDFVIADTVLNVKKPLLLFCQGSFLLLLFLIFENNRLEQLHFGILDLETIKKNIHVLVI